MAGSRHISVEALRHKDKRRNIPTAELEPVMDEKDKSPIRLAYERRNRDLDPQLVWLLDHLKTAGVQQAHKADRIAFTALTPWPGKLISAEGRYSDGGPLPFPPPLAGEGRVRG